MKFKCKTTMWASYKKDQILDVDVQWEGNLPYFYKKCKLFGNEEEVRRKFYLFPDHFEPVE